ncbi:hypothetical protein TVAG_306230 [Trichomonas vaginalis G3]|uniref:receptor protein-tyrosine kinase n=1 Tax=Trichomonas vaginalis (strain ATCC PRA-98 / G3) TaxID=412133 RepID=A2DNB4_TRIV3|nr:glycine-rich protein family [Trichomonas vaginalis G3]EAY18102.1 hypothetical protein TVAG_306230 [Trichomonas vaginalis G3]KAI5492379.1 glycine-rich protein family [Trichomonas vaginalis G3]|eukprot:XP_001579088.1 hypothetical protein [Trichomonas vaginalis G3]
MNQYIQYSLDSAYGTENVTKSRSSFLFGYPCTDANNCTNYEVNLQPAIYKIECWGSSGNNGNGAYTKGFIEIKKSTTIYLYIGRNNGRYNSVPPYAATSNGKISGGSTDIRLIDGDFYDFESLKSRIMVAASGGSSERLQSTKSHAGGLTAINSTSYKSSTEFGGDIAFILNGATQISPGNISYVASDYTSNPIPGHFGIAGYINETNDWGGVAGNGYYAGCSVNYLGASTGGSSFISGHPGCDAISNDSSSFDNITHTGQPVHYSNLSFFGTEMIDGLGQIPLPWIHRPFKNKEIFYNTSNTDYYETGHHGNGFVRISLFDEAIVLTCKIRNTFSNQNILSFLVFILIYSE